MRYILYKGILLCWLIGLFAAKLYAQNPIEPLQKQLDLLREKAPLEKLFVHTDKEQYLIGDTLWYKTYVMDGLEGGPSTLSGIVYLELYDVFGNMIYRHRQHLVAGSSYGEMPLDHLKLTSGKYILRAYTRWLLNFGSDYFFSKTIDVYGDYKQLWTAQIAPFIAKDTLQLQLRTTDQTAIYTQSINVQGLYKDKVVFEDLTVLKTDGQLKIPLPSSTSYERDDLIVELKGEIDGALRIPLHLVETTKNYDVQLLPEGGHWIHGLPTTMGIKVLNDQGKSVPFTGEIRSSNRQTITTFKELAFGMARFNLPALPSGAYEAVFHLPDGVEKTIPLPAPKPEGVVLQQQHELTSTDQWSFHLYRSEAWINQSLYIALIQDGHLYYGSMLKGNQQPLQTFSIQKQPLPEGLFELRVLNEEGQPLASRHLFHSAKTKLLHVDLQLNQSTYATRSPVQISLAISDAAGQPVQANMSLVVTDDLQYKSINKDHLYAHYFLGSQLQGEIEQPGFYFSQHPNAAEAMENLLLTQGWVSYDTQLLSSFETPSYKQEPRFEISGQVLSAFNKPIPKAKVNLVGFGEKGGLYLDTLTDQQGSFAFNTAIPHFEEMGFAVSSFKGNGRTFNMGLLLHPDTPLPKFSLPKNNKNTPWYLTIDSTKTRNFVDQQTHRIAQHYGDSVKNLRRIQLSEVKILTPKSVKNSKNLNGPGKADIILDEEDFLKNKGRNLLQVLKESIPEFRETRNPKDTSYFRYKEKPVIMVIDGRLLVDTLEQKGNPIPIDYIARIEDIPAINVMGIELMYGLNNIGKYAGNFASFNSLYDGSFARYAYIEVTTRNGRGSTLQKGYTDYIQTVNFHWPKQFYAPKYKNQERSVGQDLRSTIHWEPFIISNLQGQAHLTFYTSDQKGTYTLILQGMDEKGNFVYQTKKIQVE
jgi:hypothetical protein